MTVSLQPSNVAGHFYPADPGQLAASVDASLARAGSTPLAPKAVIAPHAGYIYSGDIAGAAGAINNCDGLGDELFAREDFADQACNAIRACAGAGVYHQFDGLRGERLRLHGKGKRKQRTNNRRCAPCSSIFHLDSETEGRGPCLTGS